MLVLLATFQTNMASPIAINNEELGLLVKIDMTQNEFLRKAAETKVVSRIYKFSLHKPDIKIIMLPEDVTLVSFNTDFQQDENSFGIEYFLLKTYSDIQSSTYMILETSGPDAQFLRSITQYGKKNRREISITGAITNLDEYTVSLKNHLQTKFGRVRPVKMKILKINFEDSDRMYKQYLIGIINEIVIAVAVILIFFVYVSYVWAEIPVSLFIKTIAVISVLITLLFIVY